MRDRLKLIISEDDLSDLLRAYIKQMVMFTYHEEYIGKTLAYVFQSLEEKNNAK